MRTSFFAFARTALVWGTVFGITVFVVAPQPAVASKSINIIFDHQDYALSCEVAALKMALRYKGIRTTEGNLMARVGYDTTRRRTSTWGDPNKGFVGNIRGVQNTTGYGVHWDPIAKAARAYRPAEVKRYMSVRQLTAAIDSNDPVIVWGTYRGTAYYDPWFTPSGQKIAAWFGEHTRVVMGYLGTTTRPTHIITMDPVTGKRTWTVDEFRANWLSFKNTGVIVR